MPFNNYEFFSIMFMLFNWNAVLILGPKDSKASNIYKLHNQNCKKHQSEVKEKEERKYQYN